MAYTLGEYQNEDTRQQTIDLLNNLSNTPGVGGVSIIGIDIDADIINLVNTSTVINYKVYSISISNVGDNAGEINGKLIPSGAVVNFAAGLNNTYPSSKFTLNAVGTEFLITLNKAI